ncbi:MAG: cellulase family glycosylhydrolase [Myxococcales bacterium]|nr:cellulase family glycosylhydrolase [Myxococcales bacterium]
MRTRFYLTALLLRVVVGCQSDTDDGVELGSVLTDTHSDESVSPSSDLTEHGVDADMGYSQSPECKPISPVVRETARLTVFPQSATLRDIHGRDVVFRGINAGGRSKWSPFVPFMIEPNEDLVTFRRKARAYFSLLPYWGLDSVRLVFSWEAFEPKPLEIDEVYLDRYVAMIDSAWEHGVSVIVDIHQDIYSSPFCGDGFPPWTLPPQQQGPPQHDCRRWFMKYLFDADVRAAFDRFWSDETGVRTAFARMWTQLATRVGGHPGVLAFEILNEPGWGTNNDVEAFKATVLRQFYEEITDVLRKVEPDILVIYGGVGMDAVNPSAGHYPPARDNVMYGPHVYDAGLLAGGAWTGGEPAEMLSSLSAFQMSTHIPVMIGEFGVTDKAPGADKWLELMMDGIDTHRFSATLWEYSHNEELWNHEDLSVVDADGTERIVLDTYVRPWLRAVSGKLPRFSWSTEHGGTASWIADGGVTEIVFPPRLFPSGPQQLRISGEGVCHTWDPQRPELRVTALPDTLVTVHFHSIP